MIARPKIAVLATIAAIATMFTGGASAQEEESDLRPEFRFALREFVRGVELPCGMVQMSEKQHRQLMKLRQDYDLQMLEYEGTALDFDAAVAHEDAYREVNEWRARVRCANPAADFASEDTEAAQMLIDTSQTKFNIYTTLGAELAASGVATISPADTKALRPATAARADLRYYLHTLYEQRHELCPLKPVTAHGGLWAEIDHSFDDLKARLEATPLRHDFATAEVDGEYQFQRIAALVDCMAPDEVDEETIIASSSERYQAAREALENASAAADKALEMLR